MGKKAQGIMLIIIGFFFLALGILICFSGMGGRMPGIFGEVGFCLINPATFVGFCLILGGIILYRKGSY